MNQPRKNQDSALAEQIENMLKDAGWGSVGDSRIQRRICKKGESKPLGYLLSYLGTRLAVIEACESQNTLDATVQRAMSSAEKAGTHFAYAIGDGLTIEMDFLSDTQKTVDTIPSPESLWEKYSKKGS